MNRDLFLAILSMDSYNRGYGQGLSGLSASGQLGKAEITSDSLVLGGTPDDRTDAAAGFYAIAYDVSNAGVEGLTGTVIAYRGTNFDTGDDETRFFDSPLWRDIRSGWSVGAGLGGAHARFMRRG